jgi:hypothetical protein
MMTTVPLAWNTGNLRPAPATQSVGRWGGPALLLLMAAVHQTAPPDRKVRSLAALAFAMIYGTLITSVYCDARRRARLSR